MKRGFVDIILLGFVLFAGAIALIGTLSDEIVVHNKMNDIKNLTTNTALAAAKHYMINEDTAQAETVANNILTQSKVGAEIVGSITYNWQLLTEPFYVDVSLSNYTQDTFWYRFFQKDSFTIPEIESRAQIVDGDPFKTDSDILAPLAINQCNRNDLTSENKIDFTFTVSDDYRDTALTEFFAVDPECNFPAGNSNFAHFKNLFNQSQVDYINYDIENASDSCLVQTSFQNPRSVDPMQLYNNLRKFNLPYEMDILMFDCGTTADSLIVSGILNIQLSNVYELVDGPVVSGENTKLLTIEATIGGVSEVVLEY